MYHPITIHLSRLLRLPPSTLLSTLRVHEHSLCYSSRVYCLVPILDVVINAFLSRNLHHRNMTTSRAALVVAPPLARALPSRATARRLRAPVRASATAADREARSTTHRSRPPAVRARLQRAEELLRSVRAAQHARTSTASVTRGAPANTRTAIERMPPRPLPAAASAARQEELAARAAKSADAGPRYDASAAAELFRGRGLYVRRRQLQIAVPLTAFVARVALDIRLGREEKLRRQRAKEFLDIVSSLGPAIIKGGQAVSSRPDLLPPEYLDELQKLQDRLPPFSNEIAFAQIERELGKPVDEIFEYIDPTPVAAASIGQVYRARLRGTREEVAVKVQRPDCERVIALDIYILRNLSGTLNRLLRLIGRDVDLQKIIEEFGKLIYEEIDYITEARNGERFMELYGDLPDVEVPRVYWRYTKRTVLTMQWMDGERLTSPKLSRERSEQLVRAMVQCSLQQMLENGYFHADTHLGNLLATDTGTLCYLDFGMMSEVEPGQRYGIIEAVVHMVNRDFDALANLYVRLGFLPADIDLTPIVAALNDALPDVLGASVGELNFKSVIDKLGSVMYKYPFNLPPYYTAIIRCLGVLEGVAIQVDPNFKILRESYPYIASRLLTDPAPELQQALQCLLFDGDRPRWNRLESLLESAAAAGGGDYDVSQAAEQLIAFVLSPQGKQIRYNLADELTAEVDALSADVTQYYVSAAARAGAAAGVRLPRALAALPPPTTTPTMLNAERVARILSRSPGFSASKMRPLVFRLLREPEGQRIGLEVAVSLAERFASRAVRATFGLPPLEDQRPPRGVVVQESASTAATTDVAA